MNKIDGGSAFPAIYGNYNQDGGLVIDSNGGMTLRDYFASQAMAGLISSEEMNDRLHEQARNKNKNQSDELAAVSYAVADAMLRERTK